MEVATTTTEAHLSAIHQSLLQISATLGRMLTYGCVNATSSPDAVVPAKCSTVGLNPNIGAVEVVEITHGVAAAALPAPLLLPDRIVASVVPEMALHLGAPKVFEEIPMSSDTTSVVSKLHAETGLSQCNFCGISISRKDAKAMQLATDHFLNKMPSWRRNGFSPGYYLQPHLGITPSSSREVSPDCLPIILAKFDTYSVKWWALYKCILNVAKAAVRIMLNLTLGDVFCLIWKIFRMAVNFQYTFQLYGHLLPWYRCSIFVPLESTSLHMFQVSYLFAYRCSMAVLVTYQSVHTFQVDFSFVDDAIAAISFELEVKASRQMYWPWYPGIWSNISEGITQLIAQEETETHCGASRSDSSLPDTASDLAFVHVIWQYQTGQWDSFFQEEMVQRNQQKAGSGCYFHMQSSSFVLSIVQLCNMSMPDGIPWDPGGIIGSRIQAIAWGQAMFCRGGSVTPYITPGQSLRYGPRSWARPGRSSLGAGPIKTHARRSGRTWNRTDRKRLWPSSSSSYLLSYPDEFISST